MKRRILFVVVLFCDGRTDGGSKTPLHGVSCRPMRRLRRRSVVAGGSSRVDARSYRSRLCDGSASAAGAGVGLGALDGRRWRRALAVYLVAVSVVAAAVFAVDLGLYGYWGFRIDSSVLLYLKSPKEAAASVSGREWLVQGSIFLLAAAVLSAVLLSVCRVCWRRRSCRPQVGRPARRRCFCWAVSAFWLYAAVRASPRPMSARSISAATSF